MNANTVDSQTLYKAYESMWKFVEKLLSSEDENAADSAAPAQNDADDSVAVETTCYDDWRELSSLEAAKPGAAASSRWTLGKE